MRAALLSMQFSRRREAIQAMESMDRVQELTPRERFRLATLYAAEGDLPKCRSEMRQALGGRPPPAAVTWSSTLDLPTRTRRARRGPEMAPRSSSPSSPAIRPGWSSNLEANLLKVRKQDRELAALIRNYVQQYPEQTRTGAVLFDRFGLLKEAEQAYRADVARKPDDAARVVALIEFLARRGRPQEAVDLCEQAMSDLAPRGRSLGRSGDLQDKIDHRATVQESRVLASEHSSSAPRQSRPEYQAGEPAHPAGELRGVRGDLPPIARSGPE